MPGKKRAFLTLEYDTDDGQVETIKFELNSMKLTLEQRTEYMWLESILWPEANRPIPMRKLTKLEFEPLSMDVSKHPRGKRRP